MTEKKEGEMAETDPMQGSKDQAAASTILVVSDHPNLYGFLVDALTIKFACDVLTVTTGESALEMVNTVKPDLLIIDDQLPDFKALELSDRLHGIEGLASVPTILINQVTSGHSLI